LSETEAIMGHSITDFRRQCFGTKDFKLDVWLKLLARTIAREECPPGWLAEARDYWSTVGDWAGVGCIEAALDRFLIDQSRTDLVTDFAEQTLRFLEAQGPVLTHDFLNQIDPDSNYTVDLDTEKFARVGRAFIGLLREQFEKDAAAQWF
jgi:hypothetical protein